MKRLILKLTSFVTLLSLLLLVGRFCAAIPYQSPSISKSVNAPLSGCTEAPEPTGYLASKTTHQLAPCCASGSSSADQSLITAVTASNLLPAILRAAGGSLHIFNPISFSSASRQTNSPQLIHLASTVIRT